MHSLAMWRVAPFLFLFSVISFKKSKEWVVTSKAPYMFDFLLFLIVSGITLKIIYFFNLKIIAFVYFGCSGSSLLLAGFL